MEDEPQKIERRTVLSIGIGAVFAGCVQGNDGGSPRSSATMRDRQSALSADQTTSPDQSPTTISPAQTTGGTERHETDGGFVEIRSKKSEPQATASIGDTDASATITIWNDAETSQAITVGVAERESDGLQFHETYRLEPDAYVEIGLSKIGKHTVSVGFDDDKPTAIEFVTDNCNSQALNVAVRENGTVDSTTVSTLADCG